MTLPDLKEIIMQKKEIPYCIIFECEYEDFIPIQYIKEIANYNNSSIVSLENIEEYPLNNSNIFEETVNALYVYKCEELKNLYSIYSDKSNLFIICNKLNKSVSDIFKDNIVKIPKLEEWQLKDYAQIICPGLKEEQADWLSKNCNCSAYRLTNEINKLLSFPVSTRDTLCREFINYNVFNETANNNIFDLINAIQSRDISKTSSLLKSLDITSMGLATLLYNNFKKLIKVWLGKSPTEANTGLKANQIYAINKLPRTYSKEQLLKIFDILTNIDYKLKNGDIPESLITDYLVTSILTA